MAAIALPVPAEPPVAGVAQPSAETPVATPPVTGENSTEGSAAPPPADPAAAAEKERHARAVAAGERARKDQAARRERAAREDATRGELAKLREERDARAKLAEDREIAADKTRPVTDRAAALRRLGIDPRLVAQAALEADTPEAAMNAAIEKRLGPVTTELEQLRAWKAAQDQRESAARAARGQEELTKSIADAAKYPHLSKQPASVLLAAAENVMQKVSSRLTPAQVASITDADIFEYLEEQYTAHAKSASPATPAPGSDTPSVSTPNDKAGSTTPRTITNDLANPRLPSSLNFDEMDLEEQKARMVKELKEKRSATK